MNTPPLHIERLDLKARGIAEHAGMQYVCDGALPGETVSISEATQRRGRVVARQVSILSSTAARTAPLCHYYGECGGCQLQHAEYAAQLNYKQMLLQTTLHEYGEVQPASWLAPIASAPTHYRRRARLRVRSLPSGEVVIGFNRKHRSWLLDIASCPVLEARLGALLGPLHELVRQLHLRQRLPQIELVAGDVTVAVVFRHLQALTQTDRELLGEFATQQDVVVFTQSGGPDTALVLDPSHAAQLEYSLPQHAITLQFAPTDFIQANAAINRALVDEVLARAQLHAQDTLLDLYCGIGNLSLPLARYAGYVLGVEAHAGLVLRANDNAARNGLHNVEFIAADLCHWQPRIRCNKLVLDPPREGAIDIIKRLPHDSIEKIIYVSCDPRTLARDARYLVGRGGYCFTQARLVDMFPQTRHIETVAVFDR